MTMQEIVWLEIYASEEKKISDMHEEYFISMLFRSEYVDRTGRSRERSLYKSKKESI